MARKLNHPAVDELLHHWLCAHARLADAHVCEELSKLDCIHGRDRLREQAAQHVAGDGGERVGRDLVGAPLVTRVRIPPIGRAEHDAALVVSVDNGDGVAERGDVNAVLLVDGDRSELEQIVEHDCARALVDNNEVRKEKPMQIIECGRPGAGPQISEMRDDATTYKPYIIVLGRIVRGNEFASWQALEFVVFVDDAQVRCTFQIPHARGILVNCVAILVNSIIHHCFVH